MTPRSSRREVRNPLLGLEEVQALLELDLESRLAIATLCRAIHANSRARAEKCWRTHKAPMATYWKGCSVVAGHVANVVVSRSERAEHRRRRSP
ncbi:hypothetical protein L6Q21_09785 [Sandaracinobacter sp. RS1-74]|nr:hypothetical protein [Sandaracinobacteroides sayramensis]